MAARRAHISAWKARLQAALTETPQSTSALAKAASVQIGTARKLLNQLRAEGLAYKTHVPRERASGSPPQGWRLAKAA